MPGQPCFLYLDGTPKREPCDPGHCCAHLSCPGEGKDTRCEGVMMEQKLQKKSQEISQGLPASNFVK